MKKYHLVRFISTGAKFPFVQNEIVLMLGEVKQMPGHCVVARANGMVVWGYHTENFVALRDDEA